MHNVRRAQQVVCVCHFSARRRRSAVSQRDNPTQEVKHTAGVLKMSIVIRTLTRYRRSSTAANHMPTKRIPDKTKIYQQEAPWHACACHPFRFSIIRGSCHLPPKVTEQKKKTSGTFYYAQNLLPRGHCIRTRTAHTGTQKTYNSKLPLLPALAEKLLERSRRCCRLARGPMHCLHFSAP